MTVLVVAGAVLKAVWGWIKSLPWQAWVLIALMASHWLWGEWRYDKGYTKAQNEIEAETKIIVEERIVETTKVETVYVDRIREIKVKGDEIIREVEVFVPVDSGMLGGGWRLFHDASARNTIPDPAEIPHAAPVAAQDAAAVVSENYTACNAYIEQLNGWIDWAEAQCRLNKRGCT